MAKKEEKKDEPQGGKMTPYVNKPFGKMEQLFETDYLLSEDKDKNALLECLKLNKDDVTMKLFGTRREEVGFQGSELYDILYDENKRKAYLTKLKDMDELLEKAVKDMEIPSVEGDLFKYVYGWVREKETTSRMEGFEPTKYNKMIRKIVAVTNNNDNEIIDYAKKEEMIKEFRGKVLYMYKIAKVLDLLYEKIPKGKEESAKIIDTLNMDQIEKILEEQVSVTKNWKEKIDDFLSKKLSNIEDYGYKPKIVQYGSVTYTVDPGTEKLRTNMGKLVGQVEFLDDLKNVNSQFNTYYWSADILMKIVTDVIGSNNILILKGDSHNVSLENRLKYENHTTTVDTKGSKTATSATSKIAPVSKTNVKGGSSGNSAADPKGKPVDMKNDIIHCRCVYMDLLGNFGIGEVATAQMYSETNKLKAVRGLAIRQSIQGVFSSFAPINFTKEAEMKSYNLSMSIIENKRILLEKASFKNKVSATIDPFFDFFSIKQRGQTQSIGYKTKEFEDVEEQKEEEEVEQKQETDKQTLYQSFPHLEKEIVDKQFESDNYDVAKTKEHLSKEKTDG